MQQIAPPLNEKWPEGFIPSGHIRLTTELSERQFHSKLYVSSSKPRRGSRRTGNHTSAPAIRSVALEYRKAWKPKLGMIQQIEAFNANLQLESFSKRKILRECKVYLIGFWTIHCVLPEISVSASG